MASVFKKTMIMLGLVPDEEEYEDEYQYDPYEEQDFDNQSIEKVDTDDQPTQKVATISKSSEQEISSSPTGRVRLREAPVSQKVTPLKVAQPVANVSAKSSRPYVIAPKAFAELQKVADRLKENQPVIMNLEIVQEETRRRMIDFCAGVTYAINGTMEKVAEYVFLMTPYNVEVSKDVRSSIQRRHFPRS